MIISGNNGPSFQPLSPAASQTSSQSKLQHLSQSDSDVLPDPVGTKDSAEKAKEEPSGGVKSFAYGALGMDHPDEVEKKEDDSYTAGQYLKAAATIGSVIALFV
ncbi:hypothetical protein [Shewanella atlantica]|uniref:hypothetical protein n=1 Tax=Shewanella atlantica TaxID=271099 RepID=UPI0037358780